MSRMKLNPWICLGAVLVCLAAFTIGAVAGNRAAGPASDPGVLKGAWAWENGADDYVLAFGSDHNIRMYNATSLIAMETWVWEGGHNYACLNSPNRNFTVDGDKMLYCNEWVFTRMA